MQTWDLKFNQEFYGDMQISTPGPQFMTFEVDVCLVTRVVVC